MKVKKRRFISKTKAHRVKKTGHIMDLVIGGVLANVGSKIIAKFANFPMSNLIIPAAVGAGAYYLRPPYSDGMVVGASLRIISEASKAYLPESVSTYLAGENEYVIQGAESADPLLGAQYLLGEDQASMNPLDRTEYVVSGSSDDPLD